MDGGNKMSGLICHDCHIFRNKFASTVTKEFSEKGIKSIRIVGHRCIKCTRKAYVANMETGEGRGWRQNFRQFVMAMQDQQRRTKEGQSVAVENFASSTPQITADKKTGFGEKIASFFNRGNGK